MTPELAAALIESNPNGDHQAGVYEAIANILVSLDDELYCEVKEADDQPDDRLVVDLLFTLTHGDDIAKASTIADFFLRVGDLLSFTQFRHIFVDVLLVERRTWSS